MLGKIKSIFTKNDEEKLDKITLFVGLVENYLKREYPNITFDLSFYKTLQKDETQNEQIKKTLIIREIVKQFSDFPWEKTTQKAVKKDLLWSGYGLNSTPASKVPIDFQRRKELVFFRDLGTCNRCGNIIEKIQKSYTVLAKESSENGGYNLENIILLCQSCYNLVQYKDKNFAEIPLRIRDDLYDMI